MAKKLRGNYFGEQMMKDAEYWAKNQGFNCLYLEADEAVGFYEKLGYTRLQRAVYHGCLYKNKVYSLYKEC